MIKIRIHYDEMTQITQMFKQQEDAIKQVNRKLKSQQGVLEGGEWIGKGATKFFQEMNNEIMPSMTRLEKAMGQAAQVTRKIHNVMEQAESEASSVLKIVVEVG